MSLGGWGGSTSQWRDGGIARVGLKRWHVGGVDRVGLEALGAGTLGAVAALGTGHRGGGRLYGEVAPPGLVGEDRLAGGDGGQHLLQG